MARAHKSFTASLCLVVVKTARFPRGFSLGFVENLNVGQSYNNEIVRGIGSQKGIENVPNGVVQADVSWTSSMTADQHAQRVGTIPRNHAPDGLADNEPITVLFFDDDKGLFLAEVESVLPNQIGITTGAQTTVKESWSGTGLSVRFPDELNP